MCLHCRMRLQHFQCTEAGFAFMFIGRLAKSQNHHHSELQGTVHKVRATKVQLDCFRPMAWSPLKSPNCLVSGFLRALLKFSPMHLLQLAENERTHSPSPQSSRNLSLSSPHRNHLTPNQIFTVVFERFWLICTSKLAA